MDTPVGTALNQSIGQLVLGGVCVMVRVCGGDASDSLAHLQEIGRWIAGGTTQLQAVIWQLDFGPAWLFPPSIADQQHGSSTAGAKHNIMATCRRLAALPLLDIATSTVPTAA